MLSPWKYVYNIIALLKHDALTTQMIKSYFDIPSSTIADMINHIFATGIV